MYLNPTLCKSNLTCAIPTIMITLLLLQVVQKISPETKCIANSNNKTALSSINDVSLSMYNGTYWSKKRQCAFLTLQFPY